jgi:hypothetical protein
VREASADKILHFAVDDIAAITTPRYNFFSICCPLVVVVEKFLGVPNKSLQKK